MVPPTTPTSWAQANLVDWSTLALRELIRRLDKSATMPQTYLADVPFWGTLAGRQFTGKVSFLLPHGMLSNIAPPGRGESFA
eukprot:261605-Pyramimonas_sp.AAC.1